ncbi:MAG: tRNA-specific 2-thiouridylase [Parcubacteria group bacterium Licking1014_17]|nr:MAG: tRNA-specific 2-thiouridylase [Parcubacteria group bacterium Licking1014_17]
MRKISKENSPLVYVAMSGGVDSSVAAALLSTRGGSALGGKKQGFNVTGVFFKPWQPSKNISFCLWKKDREDAMKVAGILGIKFKTWDFSKEYGQDVVKYMVTSYRKGITPNPDVMCNKKIKFGLFLKKALAEGADFIATGHYARIKKTKDGIYRLLKGIDKNKDQSYFLYTLAQKELSRSIFPIGDYEKPEVRKMAKKFGLPVYNKKDSQGICFVGNMDVKNFLKKNIKPKEGNIILMETGKIIGKHDGVYYYTIGQRHGPDIKIGGGPYFVARKDVGKNILYVTKNAGSKYLKSEKIGLEKVTWVEKEPKMPYVVSAKLRYRSSSIGAKIIKSKTGRYELIFKKPAKTPAPGQSAVFYKGDKVLGGGIIK